MLNFHINEDIINQYREKIKVLDSRKSRFDYTKSPFTSNRRNAVIRQFNVNRRPVIIATEERESLETYFDKYILPDYDFLPTEVDDARENFVHTYVSINPNTPFDDWINNRVVQPNRWIQTNMRECPIVEEPQSRIMSIGHDSGGFIYNPMFRKTLPSLYRTLSTFHNDTCSTLNVGHVSMKLTGDYEKIILDSLSKFAKTLNPVSTEWTIEPANYLTLVNSINNTNEVTINE